MVIEMGKIPQEQSKSVREQVIRHVAKFSLASLIGGIGSFFNSYFAALLLGPSVWGIWQGAKLVLQYGSNLHLGVQNGMHRELPILKGKKEFGQQAAITDVTFTFSFIVAIVASLGILFSTFVITMAPELRLILRFIAAMIFLQYLNSFYGYLFRANNDFDIVSRVALINGLGSVFSIALIFFFGLSGFLSGQVLRLMVSTTYSWWKSSYVVRWRWDNRLLRALISIGFPIMLMIFANTIFTTIDRLLILKFLDAKSLGVYSLGNLIFAPMLMIFTASNSVMYPRFAEKYGETGDPSSLRRYITVPMEYLAAAVSVLVGGIYIALPLLVKVFLPEYIDGVFAARILIFGLFFYAMAGMAGNMLLTINKQVLRLWILLGSALLNLGFSYAALRLGYGIAGVAAGTSLAYVLFFVVSVFFSFHYSLTPLMQSLKAIAKTLIPVCYVGGILLLIKYLPGSKMGTLLEMVQQTLLKELIFLVLCAYPAYTVIKRSDLATLFRRRQ
ncbi:MAG: oligosaccharide flippase family protein [Thermoplasmata archaeon]|nr:oligosaccharide flippase family protein [Thermoplasmata archaeon]